MAQWHLDEIRNSLADRGWRVVSESDGDGYKTALVWAIQRSTAKGPFHLSFEALDELKPPTIEGAYAVSLDEVTGVAAYFYRKSNKTDWQAALQELMAALEKLED